MLLVMDTAEIFHSADARGGSPSALWEITWERIDCFLPHLRDELFKQTVIQGKGLSPASSKSLELTSSLCSRCMGRLVGSRLHLKESIKSCHLDSLPFPDPMPMEPHAQKPLASAHLTPTAGDTRTPGHPPPPEVSSELGACGEFLWASLLGVEQETGGLRGGPG